MGNITKFLLAAGVTAVGIGLTVYYGKKLQEKNYVAVSKEESDIPEVEKDKTIFQKITDGATKKVAKILGWVVVHEQQLQAVATILSVGAGIFHIMSAAKDYYTAEKTRKTLDAILEHEYEFRDVWNGHMDCTNNRHAKILNKLEDIQGALVPKSA